MVIKIFFKTKYIKQIMSCISSLELIQIICILWERNSVLTSLYLIIFTSHHSNKYNILFLCARNVAFASSAKNSYAGSSFPGIVDTLFEIEKLTGKELTDRWEDVKKQFAILTFRIQLAAAILQDMSSFQFF